MGFFNESIPERAFSGECSLPERGAHGLEVGGVIPPGQERQFSDGISC